MIEQSVLALDAGRSAVKAYAFSEGKLYSAVVPAIVSEATLLTDEGSAARAKVDTVTVDGKAYFCGNTARIQAAAGTTTGLNDDWITQYQYRALVLAATQQLIHMGATGLEGNPLVIVGTPAKLYASQRHQHQKITGEVLNGEVKALNQAMGAFMSFVLDENGVPVRDRSVRSDGTPKSYGVIEVGHYTTDFVLIKEGANVESLTASCEGASDAVDRLERALIGMGMKTNHLKCAEALYKRSIFFRGQEKNIGNEVDTAAEPLINKIMDLARKIYGPHIDDLDGILVAGGGAHLVRDRLKVEMHNVIEIDNPRMAVAAGYIKYGKMLLSKKHRQKVIGERNG